jgi:DNA-binding response OmpR family regulator
VTETTAANHSFLLIGRNTETQWPLVLQQALSSLGKLYVVPEEEALQAVVQDHYDVIIIDAGTVRDAVLLTSHVRVHRPEARVIIATASPTWQRARKALQAGATDYIRKSLDKKELHARVQAVLEVPAPSWPRGGQ